MGMSVKEYECMSYYNLLLKIEGFQNKQSYELDIARNHALLCTVAPHRAPKSVRNITADKIWPISGQKADNKKVPDDRRKRIAKALSTLK